MLIWETICDITSTYVWAHYLKDDLIAFRPPEESDADLADRWHESALPLTTGKALESLNETETVPWGGAPTIRLIVGHAVTGEILGGVKLEREDQKVFAFTITPSRVLDDEHQRDIAARVLRVLTPWLLDEVAVLTVLINVPTDHDHLIAAAESLGYAHRATFRESLLRPSGYIDVHIYQILNPNWTITREGAIAHV